MRKLNQLVRQHQTLKPILQAAEDRDRLQQLWQLAAPEYQAVSQAVSVDQGALSLRVSAGAVASRIKLLEASLLSKLNDLNRKTSKIKGLEIIAIRVKVQVKFAPPAAKKRIQAPSANALSTLSACADHIENPALQQALKRFVRNQR